VSDARVRLVRPTALLAVVSLAGVAVGLDFGLVVLASLTMVAMLAVGLANWRLPFQLLLVAVVYTGIPVVLLYPNTGPAALVKDVLFLIPAYVGFAAAWSTRRGPRFTFRRRELFVVGALASIVPVQTLNPAIPNLLVAAIGAKVWLAYIPLAALTVAFVRTQSDLERVLRLMVLCGVPVALLGIAQAGLIAVGLDAVAYAPYGRMAAGVTQDFAQIDIGGAILRRIPSTFTFVTQYSSFAYSMIAAAYAWFSLTPRGSARHRIAGLIWVVYLMSALTSGAREAYVIVPVLVLLTVVIEGRISVNVVLRVGALCGVVVAALSVLGIGLGAFVEHLAQVAAFEFDLVIVQGMERASRLTFLGLGTGADTSAARYASDAFQATGGMWFESWYFKTWLELGILGLALVALGVATSLALGLTAVKASANRPGMRACAASLTAFIVIVFLAGVKGPLLDVDPVNVHLWVYLGLLIAIRSLGVRDSVDDHHQLTQPGHWSPNGEGTANAARPRADRDTGPCPAPSALGSNRLDKDFPAAMPRRSSCNTK
jgi:hypothetical protein